MNNNNLRVQKTRTRILGPVKRKEEELLYAYLDGKAFGIQEAEFSLKKYGKLVPAYIGGLPNDDPEYKAAFTRGFLTGYK